MSFCEEQKKEIINAQYKSLCCRRNLLLGVLAGKGTVNGDAVEIRVCDQFVRAFLTQLIKEIYSKDATELTAPSGGKGKILRFASASAVKYISEIQENPSKLMSPRCSFCRGAFLRGLFLSAGRVSDPQKQYSLELSVASAVAVEQLLFSLDIPLKTANRATGAVLYTKNSTVIEDFFGLASMNTTAFSVMNSKIKSELRNDANRVSNCEMNNINKAVNTAIRQIAVISALEKRGLLGALPDELAHTARLRLEYDSLSLSQLAAKFTPSISKPGLSHRLNKIEELGKKLLEN